LPGEEVATIVYANPKKQKRVGPAIPIPTKVETIEVKKKAEQWRLANEQLRIIKP